LLIALPDEEGGFDLSVTNFAAAMNERGKAHGAKGFVGKQAEVALLVAALKGDGEDFLGEPAVEQAQLRFAGDVFEVVIDDGNVTDAVMEGAAGEFDGELGALAEIENPGEFGAASAESITEDIANFPAFVAGEVNFAASAELETQVAETGGGSESFGAPRVFGEQKILLVAGFAGQTAFCNHCVKTRGSFDNRFFLFGKKE